MKKNIQEAIRFSKKDYSSVLNDPFIVVGFEVEFDPNSKNSPETEISRNTRIIRELKEAGINVKIGAQTSGSSDWALVNDGSITTVNGESGLELVSPPMQIKYALEQLRAVFDWMESNDYRTNSSTGFHVSVSYENSNTTQEADSLKLVLLLGEPYVAKLFDRVGNAFTKSHLTSLKTSMKMGKWINEKPVQELLDIVRSNLVHDKYYTVNLTKKASSGYFEFRIMGNKDYNKRFNEVENTIIRYGFVLRASLDPTAYRREYLEELGSILQGVIDNASVVDSGEYPDNITKYIVLGNVKPELNLYRISQIKLKLEMGKPKLSYPYLSRAIADTMDSKNKVKPKNAEAARIALKILIKKSGIKYEDFLNWLINIGVNRKPNPELANKIQLYLGEM